MRPVAAPDAESLTRFRGRTIGARRVVMEPEVLARSSGDGEPAVRGQLREKLAQEIEEPFERALSGEGSNLGGDHGFE
jgi:hypothetical protein